MGERNKDRRAQKLQGNNFYFNFLNLFIYSERERACRSGKERGRERERERERERMNIPSRLQTVSTESNVGLKLIKCEIMT